MGIKTIIFLMQASSDTNTPVLTFDNEGYQLLYGLLVLLAPLLITPLMQMMTNSKSFSQLQLKERLSHIQDSNKELKRQILELSEEAKKVNQDYQKLLGDVRVLRTSLKGLINQAIIITSIMKQEDNLEQIKSQINSLEILIKAIKKDLRI